MIEAAELVRTLEKRQGFSDTAQLERLTADRGRGACGLYLRRMARPDP